MTILLDIFFSPRYMKEEIIQTFQEKIRSLNKNDPCYNTRKDVLLTKLPT